MLNTATYPSGIVGLTTLAGASNRGSTTLTSNVSITDTIINVASTASFPQIGMLLISLDNELIRCFVSSLTTFTTYSDGLGDRGFDNTTIATHLSSAIVSCNLDAYHINQLNTEVASMQLNTIKRDARVYNFTIKNIGGSLSIGSNVITLPWVPPGVNGTNTFYYVYISSGVGTPEACLVTGGTAISGGSGTLIITCANTHSGNWILSSATAGIKEAINTLPLGGTVQVYPGNNNIYATIIVTGGGYAIEGDSSRGAVLITDNQTSGYTFNFDGGLVTGAQNVIKNLKMTAIGGKISGWAININNQNTFTVRDIFIGSVPNGIQISHVNTFNVYLEDINISGFLPTTGAGILINSGSGIYGDHVQINGSSGIQPLAGIQIVSTGGFYLDNSDISQSGTGLLVAPGAGQVANYGFITNTSFDTNSSWGIAIVPVIASNGVIRSWSFTNCWAATNSLSGCVIDTGVSGTIDGIKFIGHRFVNNIQRGLWTLNTATNIKLVGCTISGNGNNTTAGIEHDATGSFCLVGCTLGQSDGFPNTQTFGLTMATSASDNIVITDNQFTANLTGPLSDSTTGIHKVITNNQGIDDALPDTIASASSVTMNPNCQPITYLSGITTILTIIGGWRGRRKRFLKIDGGSLTLGGGGNIPGTRVMTQYSAVDLTFDGTNWY